MPVETLMIVPDFMRRELRLERFRARSIPANVRSKTLSRLSGAAFIYFSRLNFAR